MPRRSVLGGDQLRVVSPRRGGTRTASPPGASRSAERVGPEGDRRLTLVLGLLTRADGVRRSAGHASWSGPTDADGDSAIMVNMKLNDASISAIEAAQLLSDKCFC